ncbi:MAG: hypothetical protein AAGH15_09975 [Myxococcota bacterium]
MRTPNAPGPVRLGLATLVLALAAGCPGELEDVSRFSTVVSDFCLDPNFDVVAEFRASCGGPNLCHEGDDPAAGLDLVSEGIFERMASRSSDSCDGRLVVDPANVDESFLLDKLLGPPPGCGDRMPLVGFLNDSEVGCVARWLEEETAAHAADMGAGSVDMGSMP